MQLWRCSKNRVRTPPFEISGFGFSPLFPSSHSPFVFSVSSTKISLQKSLPSKFLLKKFPPHCHHHHHWHCHHRHWNCLQTPIKYDKTLWEFPPVFFSSSHPHTTFLHSSTSERFHDRLTSFFLSSSLCHLFKTHLKRLKRWLCTLFFFDFFFSQFKLLKKSKRIKEKKTVAKQLKEQAYFTKLISRCLLVSNFLTSSHFSHQHSLHQPTNCCHLHSSPLATLKIKSNQNKSHSSQSPHRKRRTKIAVQFFFT